jgi:predicted acetyltransferase
MTLQPTAPIVTLERATPDLAPQLANLLELYIHDMSAIFSLDVGGDGRYGYARLPLYWSEPDTRYPFLIKSGPQLAGFALATRGSPITANPTDLDVAEFFVLRRYRRSGVGRQAACALWDALPGQWIVRVSEANRGGLAFWRDVVHDYTNGTGTESTRPGHPHGWRVFTLASTARRIIR